MFIADALKYVQIAAARIEVSPGCLRDPLKTVGTGIVLDWFNCAMNSENRWDGRP